jgi:magnesium transporter
MSLVKSSLPWLILLMVLGIFSSLIINKFESQIATVIIMSSFIPLLLASAGNAGTQTASLVIRSLALNEYHKGEYRKIIGKEIKTGLLVWTFSCSWFGIIYFCIYSSSIYYWDSKCNSAGRSYFC